LSGSESITDSQKYVAVLKLFSMIIIFNTFLNAMTALGWVSFAPMAMRGQNREGVASCARAEGRLRG
jgi:hypothetical protein